jgi:hypothetical protein
MGSVVAYGLIGVSRKAGGSAIDVLAMPDSDDEDHQLRVTDRVDDPIPAYSDAVPIVLAGELFATGGPGIIGQRTDAGDDALTILLLVNGLDLFGRGRLDQDLIFSHAA